ncbi:MAG: protein phosphatase 2C family protein [Saprospiraceae bacterium]|nr:protein phosphatase 2C family protein [Saprospiraceae bacterium]
MEIRNDTIALQSICDPNKTRCGDFCKYEHVSLENLFVFTLADGVGSNVCDWKASRFSCDHFLAHFMVSNKNLALPDRIKESIMYANKEISQEDGQCQGMKSTLVVGVWDFSNEKLYFANIGDSRLYILEGKIITQVTIDQTKTIIRKTKDGKPLVYAGVVVTATGVTNVIGALETVGIGELCANKLDGIILASDGFYDCAPTFKEDVLSVFKHQDMDKRLNRITSLYKDVQKDDMTVLIFRKPEININTHEIIYKLQDNSEFEVSLSSIIHALNIELAHGINKKNSEICRFIMTYCQKHNISFSQEAVQIHLNAIKVNEFNDGFLHRELIKMLSMI